MKALIASGKYKTILTKWGVQAGAITDREDQRRHELAQLSYVAE